MCPRVQPPRIALTSCVRVAALALRMVAQVLELGTIAKRHWRVVACSAHDGTGLLDGFDFIVNDISSRIYLFND